MMSNKRYLNKWKRENWWITPFKVFNEKHIKTESDRTRITILESRTNEETKYLSECIRNMPFVYDIVSKIIPDLHQGKKITTKTINSLFDLINNP